VCRGARHRSQPDLVRRRRGRFVVNDESAFVALRTRIEVVEGILGVGSIQYLQVEPTAFQPRSDPPQQLPGLGFTTPSQLIPEFLPEGIIFRVLPLDPRRPFRLGALNLAAPVPLPSGARVVSLACYVLDRDSFRRRTSHPSRTRSLLETHQTPTCIRHWPESGSGRAGPQASSLESALWCLRRASWRLARVLSTTQ
jgi:hypothetical protein